VTGRLIGIARRARKRAPMEEIERARVTPDGGVEGNFGRRHESRAVTVLSREAWQAALEELGASPAEPWTIRRANLFVEGVDLPKRAGARLRIGGVLLETTCETDPCKRIDEQLPGLRRALTPDWRGGVRARVLEAGEVRLDDEVTLDPSGEGMP